MRILKKEGGQSLEIENKDKQAIQTVDQTQQIKLIKGRQPNIRTMKRRPIKIATLVRKVIHRHHQMAPLKLLMVVLKGVKMLKT